MEEGWFSEISVRLSGENTQASFAAVQEKWDALVPEHPFNGFFFDSVYNNLYQAESRLSALMKWLTVIAIFITCLGLFGLSSFTAERRKKEIGIRKILGASNSEILSLLSKEYIGLILIGLLVGTPLAWFFSQRWLADFAYRISFSWWMPVLAGILVLLIAGLTVSFQGLRAAWSNPVDSLRSE